MTIIPINSLNPDTLQAIMTDFVLREGSDYGENEYALADKIAQVLAHLKAGSAVLTFDNQTESINIIPCENYTHFADLSETTSDSAKAEEALLAIRQQFKI